MSALPSTDSLRARGTDTDYDAGVALYNPNGALAMVGFITFGAVAGLLWTRFFKTGRKKAKWTLALILGTTFMSLGYLLRFARRNHISAWPFVFESIFLLTSPCAFLAFDYSVLPRLSMYLGADDCLWMRRTWIVKMFVLFDVLTFLAQLGGSALQAATGDLAKLGSKIALIGLAVQAVCFAVFISVWVVFGRRLRSLPQHGKRWKTGPPSPSRRALLQHWKTLFWAVGVSCICVAIRSVYRVVEFGAGSQSHVANAEWCLYVFDAVPMLANVVAFLVVWAPDCLPEELDDEGLSNGLPLVQEPAHHTNWS